MKIALGADHAGFELKERVKALLFEFLTYTAEPRHQRRLEKTKALEERYGRKTGAG